MDRYHCYRHLSAGMAFVLPDGRDSDCSRDVSVGYYHRHDSVLEFVSIVVLRFFECWYCGAQFIRLSMGDICYHAVSIFISIAGAIVNYSVIRWLYSTQK